ncbi:type II toxin-antitoxin system VapC family toxin [Aliirhizobium terrae]|uniref:type II toxin-antitoxin system VapC family toxin n=1 Tax=Terrirhizobium terrae TaxID=2926709 RepID=UPI00257901DD|nr:type II toxin-antitoxin system VapC family toxin [Rhizobium sp. CC-CFT758]WJH42322.1 type II toxin-antitoxin system VapC family toxin [Rhizobium sp. CC-CFT758]
MRARAAITDPENDIYVSPVSAFEIALKHRLGKWSETAQFLDTFEANLASEHFIPIPISMAHAKLAGEIPGHHRDPFDRLLAAQCRLENLSSSQSMPPSLNSASTSYGSHIGLGRRRITPRLRPSLPGAAPKVP